MREKKMDINNDAKMSVVENVSSSNIFSQM